MAYFCYVKNQQPWCNLMVMPQIIHDEKMAEYKTGTKSHIIVGPKHPLTEAEAQLPVGELALRYPLEVNSLQAM